MKKFVTYLRVSTKKQGVSGLGLEAQKATIENYLKIHEGTSIATFTDIISGKKDKRPQLSKAIEKAKQQDATIIVAKLDRISRNVSFCFALMENKVKFQCADIPDLNTLTLGFYATIAQWERERISQRTKDALRAKMKTGWKAGSKGAKNLTFSGRLRGTNERVRGALEDKNNRQVRAFIKHLLDKGKSVKYICNELNSLGYKTATEKNFTIQSVYYHIKKIKASNEKIS